MKKPMWSAMKVAGGDGITSELLPGSRGRAVLILEGDVVGGEALAVHFSWKDSSYCLRDYLNKREVRQDGLGLKPEDLWRMAKQRIACTGELFVPVENADFWTAKLNEITQ